MVSIPGTTCTPAAPGGNNPNPDYGNFTMPLSGTIRGVILKHVPGTGVSCARNREFLSWGR